MDSFPLNWARDEIPWRYEPHQWKPILDRYLARMRFENDTVLISREDFERLLTEMWIAGKED